MRFQRRGILSLLFFAASTALSAPATIPFRDKDYVEWKKMDDAAEKMFPENQFYRLYLGRSLTGLQATAVARGRTNGSALPLSGMNAFSAFNGVERYDGEITGNDWHDYQKDLWKKIIAPQIKEFLPSDEVLAGRKIVLMDYVYSGRSLYNTEGLLRYYLKKNRRKNVKVITLGFTQKKPSKGEIKMPAYIGKKVQDEAYKDFAQYPSYDTRSIAAQYPRKRSGPPRPEFDELVETVRGYVAQDPAAAISCELILHATIKK